MSFPYKNPVSSVQVNDTLSVLRDDTKGVIFSNGIIGGYQEVWSLDDLNFSTFGSTGNISNSGNTIPVSLFVRTAPFLANQITINNDGISSGRRRLGMLVYVHETDTVYQHVIPNYQTLWDNAVSGNSITTGDTTFTVSAGSTFSPNADGEALLSAWTGSTIEGVSGVTRENARWRIFYGTDITVTGGTYDNNTGTATFTNTTGGTFNITGFTTGTTEDTYVTGVTYNQLNKELTLGISDGVFINATGFAPTITGGTYSDGEISLENNDGTSTLISGLEILTHIGTTTASTVSVSGTTIDTVDATTYKAAFFDYVIDDGTNYRAGTLQSVWDGTTIRYNDFSTVDIGNTTNFVWSMELTGGNALLKADISGGTWDIRIIKHII